MRGRELIIITRSFFILIGFVVCSLHFAFARRMKNELWLPEQELEGAVLINQKTGRIKFSEKFSGFHLDFTLWVVRHGQTRGNITPGMFQGALDEDINQLTEEGKKQAEQAAGALFDKLKDKIKRNQVVVITSKLKRAKDTAGYFVDLVKRKTGITIQPVVEELASEISFGIWDNKTTEQIGLQFGPEQKDLVIGYREGLDAMISAKNGESFMDLLFRARKLLDKLNKRYKGKAVILFAHGTLLSAIRVLLGDRTLLDESGQIDWRGKMLSPASPLLLP